MGSFVASNGTYVVRNGGHLGFGASRDAAWARAGGGSGGRVDDIFLSFDQWQALEEFFAAGAHR
ncbi:nuclease [Microbacterium phage Marcie]|nr:nuclease [Microbacterium phage Marcie]